MFSSNDPKSYINSCFECEHTHIVYDSHHDEHYCVKCGLVLQQGFINYVPAPVVDLFSNEMFLEYYLSKI
ncbi:TFIIB-type zinc ribbon-containing protein [Methanobrevibacter filiformis]|uniref:TFIIB-type zinc ribbon-containing protein n=1 Tax=Methanobrevibacter filiformis TaxID=55758 RepID=UPI000A7AB327|nr:TFIIB-type zinc ribbon-containing protein [Methanobrevibacter filiformis]